MSVFISCHKVSDSQCKLSTFISLSKFLKVHENVATKNRSVKCSLSQLLHVRITLYKSTFSPIYKANKHVSFGTVKILYQLAFFVCWLALVLTCWSYRVNNFRSKIKTILDRICSFKKLDNSPATDFENQFFCLYLVITWSGHYKNITIKPLFNAENLLSLVPIYTTI